MKSIMTRMRLNRFTLTVCALLFLLGSAHAQKNQGGNGNTPTFGSVDMHRIAQEYKGRLRQAADFDTVQNTYNNVLAKLAGGSAHFLPPADIRRLAALYEKSKLSDDERRQVTALEQQGDAASARYKELETTAAPNETQKKQYQDLAEALTNGNRTLEETRAGYQQKLQSTGTAVEEKLLADIRAAIAKVAQDKGISVVFSTDVALYTANDLTGDVIKQLNR